MRILLLHEFCFDLRPYEFAGTGISGFDPAVHFGADRAKESPLLQFIFGWGRGAFCLRADIRSCFRSAVGTLESSKLQTTAIGVSFHCAGDTSDSGHKYASHNE